MIISTPLKKNAVRELFDSLLSPADIKINGDRPWDIKVLDDALFQRVLADGSLGLGEGYMDGQWECEQIDEMINRILAHDLDEELDSKIKMKLGLKVASAKLKEFVNPQSVSRAKHDVPFHYNIGNDLFTRMLDKRMTYTCAYWKDADNLDDAQEAKLDLLCRKLGLEPGMRVLDIGCGWGSFMLYAAEKYGVICDGLTLASDQTELGQQRAKESGLPVNFILQDYRDFHPEQPYDRVVSVGMIEHVGPSNYDEYFKCAKRFMKDDGVFVLHTIGTKVSTNKTDAWIDKYIFPNGVCPSLVQLTQAMEDKFVLEDLHNIGENYDKTLCAWDKNFEAHWPEIKDEYGERFFRMWRYYLLTCAGAFRCRNLNVWQFVLTHNGISQPEYVRQI